MRIPIDLINKYLKNKLNTEEIVNSLEKTEIEVEDIIYSKALDKRLITARVEQIDRHPDADRIQIVKIQTAGGKFAKVVCGAPNVAKGQIVAYAKPGSVLPSGNKISKLSIRGVDSAGMLCSAKELGRSDDHSGIEVLDPDLPLGISLCDIEDSQDIVDIKTPANRFDMLSFIGVAREIAANIDKNSLIEPKCTELSFTKEELTKIEDSKVCKRFMQARLIIDKTSKSPQWLIDSLVAAGMKPINAVVDITNFVMLETGQPSHAYDAKKINTNLKVRFAKKGEQLTTLDGTKIELHKEDLVIVDGKLPIGLAGVVGGKNAETNDETNEIILEVANFNKTTVRKTAIRHGIRTEASSRFEKGLPLPLQEYAFKRLIYLFNKICKAKIQKTANDQLYDWPWIQHIGLRMRKAEKFLGMKLDEKQIVNGLQKRGFEAEHFSIVKEARKHLGKPYKWGANFKQDGIEAFDCGYFVDYIYSLIGKMVGHQCLQLFESGHPVEVSDLKPGDAVFRDGPWEKLTRKERKGLSHVAIYIGNGRIIHAADTYRGKDGQWKKYPKNKQMVIEEPVEVITEDPDYRGARRYVDSFNHTLAVTAPWWREDVKIEQDLFEEVAKIVGYDEMPATLPSLPPTHTNDSQIILDISRLKSLLIDRGFFEIMSYSFVSQSNLKTMGLKKDDHLKVVNPLSLEQEYLRTSLMGSHLQIVKNNDGYLSEKYGFFEISRVYKKDSSKFEKSENWVLAITVVGKQSASKLKSTIDAIDSKYNWGLRFEPAKNGALDDNRSANILVENMTVGTYGQVSNKILKSYFKNPKEISFCEIQLDKLDISIKEFQSQTANDYQLIKRDVTLELDGDIWWQQIVDSTSFDDNTKKIEFIGEFENEKLRKIGRKRLSFSLTLDLGPQPTSQEITRYVNSTVKKIQNTAGLKNSIII